MEITITSAAIATLISATIFTVISIWITRLNKKAKIDNQLESILKIAIQYPYLESEDFTNGWKSNFDRNDEKYLRYDVYCELLFNFLSDLASHYHYNKNKIEGYIAIKEWVRLHGKYWKDPSLSYGNIDSYDEKFIQIIDSYLP